MGFVFQQNFLFAGTIADNVKAARPEATDEEIRQAFRDLDCLDLIEALPEGIHTPCSEKGRGLSMGQQQLVAFARALLEIGRASCRERVSEPCRSRWSPYH